MTKFYYLKFLHVPPQWKIAYFKWTNQWLRKPKRIITIFAHANSCKNFIAYSFGFHFTVALINRELLSIKRFALHKFQLALRIMYTNVIINQFFTQHSYQSFNLTTNQCLNFFIVSHFRYKVFSTSEWDVHLQLHAVFESNFSIMFLYSFYQNGFSTLRNGNRETISI